MSSPNASFPFAISATAFLVGPKGAYCRFVSFEKKRLRLEDLLLVGDLQPERENDLPLGVEPAVLAPLDAINRQNRDPCPPRQLCLRQQALFTQPLNVVAA